MTEARTMPVRREPPGFRRVEVAEVTARSPRLLAVTLMGPELVDFDIGLPAASVRLLLPRTGRHPLVIPTWNGNEFLHDDGLRPVLRTLTPRRHDPVAGTLDVEIVVHGHGPMAEWVTVTEPGDPAAISGPGRGYAIDEAAQSFLLAGDESAIPAISQLLEALPAAAAAEVLIELSQPDARVEVPAHPGAEVRWLDRPVEAPPGAAIEAAIRTATIDPLAKVWVAGEAAAMHRIRKHLFDERGFTRAQCVVRGYWKLT